MPTHRHPRKRRRYLFGPVTSAILRQRRRGELECTNPRVYALLLRAAVETDRAIRDGARRPRPAP